MPRAGRGCKKAAGQASLWAFASVLLALGRSQYIHFDTVWDNLLSVHKYLKRSSDPLFIRGQGPVAADAGDGVPIGLSVHV